VQVKGKKTVDLPQVVLPLVADGAIDLGGGKGGTLVPFDEKKPKNKSEQKKRREGS